MERCPPHFSTHFLHRLRLPIKPHHQIHNRISTSSLPFLLFQERCNRKRDMQRKPRDEETRDEETRDEETRDEETRDEIQDTWTDSFILPRNKTNIIPQLKTTTTTPSREHLHYHHYSSSFSLSTPPPRQQPQPQPPLPSPTPSPPPPPYHRHPSRFASHIELLTYKLGLYEVNATHQLQPSDP